MSRRVLTALPVYNEQHHLTGVLEEVRKYSEDILVVNDGSTDGTAEVLAREPGIQALSHPTNRGYGAALATAFEYAVAHNYEVLVTIDCDGQHEPRLIPELAEAVFPENGPPFDIVSGSRYLQPFPGDSAPPVERRRINMEITALLNERLGLSLTDSFCGFKAYRVAALPRLQITEFGYAMPLQLWVQAVATEMRIIEAPVPLIYLEEERSFGGSLDDSRRRMAYYREVLDREMAAAEISCGECSAD